MFLFQLTCIPERTEQDMDAFVRIFSKLGEKITHSAA